MKVVVADKKWLLNFFSAYAPHTGYSHQAKGALWILFDEKTVEALSRDVVVVACDLSGYVGVMKGG